MNKRQAKKKFKKIAWYNPPKNPQIQGLDEIADDIAETLVFAVRSLFDMICEIGKFTAQISNMIRSMSDEEFEKLCAELPTIESQALARRIKGK